MDGLRRAPSPKHARLFAGLGIAVAALAITAQTLGGAVVAGWLALDFLVIAIGYGGAGQVFGKRSDGSLPLWSRLVFLPYIVFTWLTWKLTCTLSRENPHDRLGDLILSRRLESHELPDGVTTVVDLTSELAEPRALREVEHYVALPTLDAGVPDPAALTRALEAVGPGTTLIHCAQGHGRTGLFAIALLVRRGQVADVESGLLALKEVRPGVGLQRHQRRFLEDFVAAS
ncbi:MAG: hypothetical protein AAF533_28900 [Acidobacteriota bacterium]